MITKSKLGEDIDILLDKISNLQEEILQVSESHNQLLNTIPHLIIMVEAMVKILSERNVLTTEEFSNKIDEITKHLDVKKDKIFEEIKAKAANKYFMWLLTKYEKYGNA